MITRDLRQAVRTALAAAGLPADTDPGLRPGGAPGGYAASVALALSPRPRELAARLAGSLGRVPWIETARVTGPIAQRRLRRVRAASRSSCITSRKIMRSAKRCG